MRTTKFVFVALMLVTAPLVTGCMSRVTLDPLPYAHPANPDAPEGILPQETDTLSGPSKGSESSTKASMQGMDHSGMQKGRDESGKINHSGTKMEHTGGIEAEPKGDSKSETLSGYYTCPMHVQVKSEKPGDCPICGMQLVPKKASASGENHAH